jgi:hypothetical protein
MKTITKEYTVYDYNDLLQDDELTDFIYQKFWLEDSNSINPRADENLSSFEKFAETLNMKIDYSLSNAEYRSRSCYVQLTPTYYEDNKDYQQLLKDYTGNGYYFCDELQTFTLELLDKAEYKVLCERSTNEFVREIQNKMLDLWFADNQDQLSKESFLRYVEANDCQFYADGILYYEAGM